MKTIVVIPVYQSMNALEKISLQQAVRIFQKEPLCLVTPKSMDVSEYLAYGDFQIERFADRWFQSIGTYSELLLDARFYERFSAYEYLLIYQLDAFVFRDDLPHFCSLGYDYFGAPWSPADWCHRVSGHAIGNGGLSLRHVRHTIAILRRYQDVIQRDWLPRLDPVGEDMVFAWMAAQEKSDYTTAPVDIALKFSIARETCHIFRHLEEKTLPFGIHKWYQLDLPIWLPYIESFGYDIDLSDEHIQWMMTVDLRKIGITNWAMERLANRGDWKRMHESVRTMLPRERSLYLRGAGKIGKQIEATLRKAQIPVDGILEQGMPLPEAQAFILVATTRYEKEIVAELQHAGRVQGRDFLTSRVFENQFLRTYYKRI